MKLKFTLLKTEFYDIYIYYLGMEFTLTFLTHLRFNFTSMQQVRIKYYESRLQTVIGLNVVF